MIKLELCRLKDNGECTIGILKLNGKFKCFTLEDTFHKVKIKGETRIPAGTYKIEYRKTGGMLQKYKEKFNDHPGMLHLLDVPNYKYVYIHIGNTKNDTLGCILVGKTADSNRGFIGQSRIAYIDLYRELQPALKNGEEVIIEIN